MSPRIIWRGTAVAVEGRALLIEGPPGSGKSTLALGLIDRGAVLIGDDAVELGRRGGILHASPPPNIEGLIECRNVGLLRMPVTDAPVALLLRLAGDAPRFVEAATPIMLAGGEVPSLLFTPGDAAGPIRAEWALHQYGRVVQTACADRVGWV